MKKFKASRKKVKFEYEFQNGDIVKVEYMEPTTVHIDEAVSLGSDVRDRLDYTKSVLKECLSGDDDVIERIIDEQIRYANIYEFKTALDEELGKLKKSV